MIPKLPKILIIIGIIFFILTIPVMTIFPQGYLKNMGSFDDNLGELYPGKPKSLYGINDLIFIAKGSDGLEIYNFSNDETENMNKIGQYKEEGEILDVFCVKNLTYIIDKHDGFIVLTVYNYQYISLVPRYLLSLFPNIDAVTPNNLNLLLTFIVLLSVFLLWEIVLRLWEKIDYIGSFEWFISKASDLILPKSKNTKRNQF